MEDLDLRRIVFEYISDNLIIDVSTETEFDYYDTYEVIRVSVRLQDPSTEEWIEVASDVDFVRTGS